MPKLSGVFDKLKTILSIPASEIVANLPYTGEIHILENFVGNRVLYPQTIPQTNFDLKFDHQILREALKREPNVVFDKKSQNIIIPEEFASRFPPFIKLVETLIDALKLEGLIGLFMKSNSIERLGTIVSANLASQALATQKNNPTILLNGELKKLRLGSINLIPYKSKQLKFKIAASPEIIIPGGKMGIFIDLRNS